MHLHMVLDINFLYNNSPESDKRSHHKANNVTRQVEYRKVLLKDLLLNRLTLMMLSNILAVKQRIKWKKMIKSCANSFHLKSRMTILTWGCINDEYRRQFITIMSTRFVPTIANVNVMIKNACITSEAPVYWKSDVFTRFEQLSLRSDGAVRIVAFRSITLLYQYSLSFTASIYLN